MDNFDYKTRDIYLASSLIASGYDYFLQKNIQQYLFCFKDKNKTIQTKVNDYWNGNLLLDPKKIFEAFKQLKVRINDYQL